MLARYKIYRGKRAPDDALPNGARQDTRKHTGHCLRPSAQMVSRYLGRPDEASWHEFASRYRQLLEQRLAEDRAPFDRLARLAADQDVYIGCSCPTAKNPNVHHCHTVIALQFMRDHYPELSIIMPA